MPSGSGNSTSRTGPAVKMQSSSTVLVRGPYAVAGTGVLSASPKRGSRCSGSRWGVRSPDLQKGQRCSDSFFL
eukprot:51375-Rhodomonas_salina.1